MDEATSALDVETEKGKMTMVIIAHRESAIENCHKKILV
jgi:ABC-type multidrug transport system fused ATPase/permease subunit